MQPRRIILGRSDLDHAAQFSAVLSGKTGGHHTHGLGILRIQRWRKGRRAVFRHRRAINDVLNIVFGAAWMQNAVGFVQPAGLGVHNILNAATGLSRHLLVNRL